MGITWEDVFDGFKLKGRPTAYAINLFVWNHTTYGYFIHNDSVFKVGRPSEFDMETQKTELMKLDLDN